MRCSRLLRAVGAGLLAAAALVGSIVCWTQEPRTSTSDPTSANSSLYVKVQLDRAVKLSKLKPGDKVEGKLARDVYSADHELFTAGSRARLSVDHLEKRRRTPDDHWPWVVKILTPRHESYPVLGTAIIFEHEHESSLQVSLISISRRREVNAQEKRKKSGQQNAEAGSVEVSKSGGLYGS